MAQQRLITYREALADAREDDGYERIYLDAYDETIWSEAPSPDFGRSAPFHLARAQLDQLVELLRRATGVHDPLVLTEQALHGLRRWAYSPRPDVRTAYEQWRANPQLRARRAHFDAPRGVQPETGEVLDGHWDFELHVVRDGLMLRRALERITDISYGYAGDGSITFEFGPQYPQARTTLGLEGNETGELTDQPQEVLEAAVHATRAAAEILAHSAYRG